MTTDLEKQMALRASRLIQVLLYSNAPKLKKPGIARLEAATGLPATLLALRHAKALENEVFEGVKTAKGHLKGHLAGITKKKGLHPCECNPLIRIWWDMCDSNARPPN